LQIDGAVIKEQGITFAIVVVKAHVIQHSLTADQARSGYSGLFPGRPIILMSQDTHGVPTYQGRKDIVKFLANLDISQIPWKTYTFS